MKIIKSFLTILLLLASSALSLRQTQIAERVQEVVREYIAREIKPFVESQKEQSGYQATLNSLQEGADIGALDEALERQLKKALEAEIGRLRADADKKVDVELQSVPSDQQASLKAAIDAGVTAVIQTLTEQLFKEITVTQQSDKQFLIDALKNLRGHCESQGEAQTHCHIRLIENLEKIVAKRILKDKTKRQKRDLFLLERARKNYKQSKRRIVRVQKKILAIEEQMSSLKKLTEQNGQSADYEKISQVINEHLREHIKRLEEAKRRASRVEKIYKTLFQLSLPVEHKEHEGKKPEEVTPKVEGLPAPVEHKPEEVAVKTEEPAKEEIKVQDDGHKVEEVKAPEVAEQGVQEAVVTPAVKSEEVAPVAEPQAPTHSAPEAQEGHKVEEPVHVQEPQLSSAEASTETKPAETTATVEPVPEHKPQEVKPEEAPAVHEEKPVEPAPEAVALAAPETQETVAHEAVPQPATVNENVEKPVEAQPEAPVESKPAEPQVQAATHDETIAKKPVEVAVPTENVGEHVQPTNTMSPEERHAEPVTEPHAHASAETHVHEPAKEPSSEQPAVATEPVQKAEAEPHQVSAEVPQQAPEQQAAQPVESQKEAPVVVEAHPVEKPIEAAPATDAQTNPPAEAPVHAEEHVVKPEQTEVQPAAAAAPVEEAKPVEVTQAAPVEATQAAPVEATQAAPVEVTQAAPVEVAQAAPVEATQAAPVEVAQAAPVEVAPAAIVAEQPAATNVVEAAAPVASTSEAVTASQPAAHVEEPAPVAHKQDESVPKAEHKNEEHGKAAPVEAEAKEEEKVTLSSRRGRLYKPAESARLKSRNGLL